MRDAGDGIHFFVLFRESKIVRLPDIDSQGRVPLGEGFGEVWGRIWEDVGAFEQAVGRLWTHLETCGPAVAKLINWTPALIREASQCAGVLPPAW